MLRKRKWGKTPKVETSKNKRLGLITRRAFTRGAAAELALITAGCATGGMLGRRQINQGLDLDYIGIYLKGKNLGRSVESYEKAKEFARAHPGKLKMDIDEIDHIMEEKKKQVIQLYPDFEDKEIKETFHAMDKFYSKWKEAINKNPAAHGFIEGMNHYLEGEYLDSMPILRQMKNKRDRVIIMKDHWERKGRKIDEMLEFLATLEGMRI